MRDGLSNVVLDRGFNGPEGVNRRLIHASLSDLKQSARAGNGARKKPSPPEQTHAEDYYYLKQMGSRTPMIVVLNSGETVHGTIEWYDRRCLKLNRVGKPNLMIMKDAIRYMYKEPTGASGGAARGTE